MDSSELLEAIGEIRESLATIAAGCKPCREQVAHLHNVVNGTNGDGLRSKVVRLETRWAALLLAMPVVSAIIAAVISKVL